MKDQKALISVIVPVYKVEAYLPSCIESLLAQTYENLEIILVDDGSPDSCGEICDAYAKKDARIKVIHKENGGVSSARNAGLEIASGEYVGFIDSDDRAKPEMYEILCSVIENSGADIVTSKYTVVREGEAPSDSAPEELSEVLSFDRRQATENLLALRHFTPDVWNKLFRAEILKDLRFDTEIALAEDYLFTASAILRADKVCSIKNKLYLYTVRSDSALHQTTFREKSALGSYSACVKVIEAVKATDFYSSLKKYTDYSMISCNINILRSARYDRKALKKYSPFVRKNLRGAINKASLSTLAPSMKIAALISLVSPRLYILLLKIKKK